MWCVQVVNGILLPCVASMLLLSLNHRRVMGAAGPQSLCLNMLLTPCVAITLYLAAVVLLKQTIGRAFSTRRAGRPEAGAGPASALRHGARRSHRLARGRLSIQQRAARVQALGAV